MATRARMTRAEMLQDIFEDSDTELVEDSCSDCGLVVEGSDDEFKDLCEEYFGSDCESEDGDEPQQAR